jgi:TetR/AcrR family transcriptional repressor of bet genes
MPKIVDHAQRRDEIALVACRVVAEHGFDKASMVRIAREAGYTTGMLAHYYDSKQDIIIAALRLILRRIDERLARPRESSSRPDLQALLTEALPVDEHRRIECAFWTSFWGQVTADKRLKRINGWVHREYMRLFERCLAQGWPESAQWTPATREQALRAVVTFVNGLTASAVANPGDWPADKQIGQLQLQLQLLHDWAMSTRGSQPTRKVAGA